MYRIFSVWLQKLKPFKYVETIAILLCKQINSNSFKKEITDENVIENTLIHETVTINLWRFLQHICRFYQSNTIIYNCIFLTNNNEHVYIEISSYIIIFDDDACVKQESHRREFTAHKEVIRSRNRGEMISSKNLDLL